MEGVINLESVTVFQPTESPVIFTRLYGFRSIILAPSTDLVNITDYIVGVVVANSHEVHCSVSCYRCVGALQNFDFLKKGDVLTFMRRAYDFRCCFLLHRRGFPQYDHALSPPPS